MSTCTFRYAAGVVRWLDEEEARAWRSFLLMKRLLERGVDRQLMAESGLSAADYELLVPLSESPGRRLRPRDLGRAADWERSRLSHQLKRMEARGLIERQECPTDARGTVIVLTESGMAALEEAAPAHVAWVRDHFVDIVGRQDLSRLADIAERVAGSLAQEREEACPARAACFPEGESPLETEAVTPADR